MWQSVGASKAPVQMRMSPSWRQLDGQNHKGCEKRQTNRQMKKGRKRVKELKKKREREIESRELLVSETMTFLPIESDA